MKIIKLKSENIKRLSAVEITPEGNLVVIGGDNGEGKTSVLDSIAYALGGKKALPEQPVRMGADEGRIVVETEELLISTTIRDGSRKLVITAKNNPTFPLSSPQAILDKLTAKFSFDPLEFLRSEGSKQVTILKQLTGIDFSRVDSEIKQLEEQRRFVKQNIQQAEGKYQLTAQHEGVPEVEQQATEILQATQRAQQVLQHVSGLISTKLKELQAVSEKEAKIRQLQIEISKHQEMAKQIDTAMSEMPSEGALKEQLQLYAAQLSGIEAINIKVRENQEKKKLQENITTMHQQVLSTQEQIDMREQYKTRELQRAKFPVPGLSFGDNAILYQGVPFDQCSAAEKLRVSVAVGIACNPELRVLLIRDGSLLDNQSLKIISDMATAHDFQIWLERVGDGKEVSVVIEDGAVKEARHDFNKGGIYPAVQ